MPMKRLFFCVTIVLAMATLRASGPLGIYGIVEKVVFEPNEAGSERIQVWGAFAYTDNVGAGGSSVSKPVRGYLYFKVPDNDATDPTSSVRREWADLKAVAGTGQAIAFGRWSYIGGFGALQPDQRPTRPSVILYAVPRGGAETDLRVRPATEAPSNPAVYQTNIGIVKLSETGNQAEIVKQLKDALARR